MPELPNPLELAPSPTQFGEPVVMLIELIPIVGDIMEIVDIIAYPALAPFQSTEKAAAGSIPHPLDDIPKPHELFPRPDEVFSDLVPRPDEVLSTLPAPPGPDILPKPMEVADFFLSGMAAMGGRGGGKGLPGMGMMGGQQPQMQQPQQQQPQPAQPQEGPTSNFPDPLGLFQSPQQGKTSARRRHAYR